MRDADVIKAGIMIAVLLIAAIRPKWIFPYLVRFGVVALGVVVALWLLAKFMGVQ